MLSELASLQDVPAALCFFHERNAVAFYAVEVVQKILFSRQRLYFRWCLRQRGSILYLPRILLEPGVWVCEALLHALNALLGGVPIQFARTAFIPMGNTSRLQVPELTDQRFTLRPPLVSVHADLQDRAGRLISPSRLLQGYRDLGQRDRVKLLRSIERIRSPCDLQYRIHSEIPGRIIRLAWSPSASTSTLATAKELTRLTRRAVARGALALRGREPRVRSRGHATPKPEC